ncbi:unnamed protein product [Mycena citricolor]|uniref:E3 ubiquitin-protein ligase n=1 Tax=Mycena citricolor TaxID=2018698 RepID=A0AAD2H4Q4_9AGAR|nr:unnamed protein product [Mycena citricolor]
MSAFSNLITSKFLHSRGDRSGAVPPESLPHVPTLRQYLEALPTARMFDFDALARADVLQALYSAFWGSHADLFLPSGMTQANSMLSELQLDAGFYGMGKEAGEWDGRGGQVVPGRPCSHVFKKGESCFRCKDCTLDDSCVLCARCFHATDHDGHNVSFFIAQQPGGCCDCGDEEAWRRPISCPFHPTDPSNHASPPSIPTSPIPDDVPPVADYPHRMPIPQNLRDSMSRTVGYALDVILDTLALSPEEPIAPANEEELRKQPSADPGTRDHFCVVLWNDDKHSFEEVAKLLAELTGVSHATGMKLAREVDEQGRAVVITSTDAAHLMAVAQALTHIDLGVTVRRAYDTFREQIVATIIEWLLDLTRSQLGSDALVLREVIAKELLSPTRTRYHEARVRLDCLFLDHTRLWKRPRLSLKEMYASILSLSRDHKLAIAGHFASVYPSILSTYLLVDREAETSIKYLALQLFTVPSAAAHVVRNHDLVARVLALVRAFFQNRIEDRRVILDDDPDLWSLSVPALDPDSFPFKSKRFMPIFSDLRHLLGSAGVRALVAEGGPVGSSPPFDSPTPGSALLPHFAATCALFVGMHPNRRAARAHVEYETEAWISVFNVALSLGRVVKAVGSAFSDASSAQLVSAISVVLEWIARVGVKDEDPVEYHLVIFGRDESYEVVDFDVSAGAVSFHHALHWLFAELCRHVGLLDNLKQVVRGALAGEYRQSVRDVDRAVLRLVDFPLRVLAMIAQIRTGLWVRNGFVIRGQLLHYRDFMLRELCYDQDLFVVQTALVLMDPDTVLASILDRFGVIGYFGGRAEGDEDVLPELMHPVYESVQLAGMVEELLYVLIAILSEASAAGGIPIEVAVRREIVHALAVGPCPFTDLVKRVAERLVDDVSFERVLDEVATFRIPENVADTGSYELKDASFDEVDPFFFHYTRNRREEVEAILLTRLRRKTGATDPVIVPRPLGIEYGPFKDVLSRCFESRFLLRILFYSVHNVLIQTDATSTPPSAEAILDQALHLIMQALVERPETFSHLAVAVTFDNIYTMLGAVCALESHDKYKTYHARAGWILDRVAVHQPAAVDAKRQIRAGAGPDAAAEAKKRAARARQEAIMRQMKAQQASFAVNFEDDVDDDDGDTTMDDDDTAEEQSFGACIVCQEDLAGRPFGSLGLVQPSRFIRRHPDSHNSYLNEVLQTPSSLDRSIPRDTKFPPQDTTKTPLDGFPAQFTRFGLHASVCTHMMHLDCFHTYNISIRQRHRSQATRNQPESISRKEFVCPLCKSLGNVILPVSRPSKSVTLVQVPFPDWIRAAGISILKSRPDPLLDSLQFRNGTGEFVFWSAQDPGYSPGTKMVDTVMNAAKSVSQHTRHLRDRPEPEMGERGAGIYLPEELVGYTLCALDVAQRGGDVAVSDAQMGMVRGLLVCLTRLAGQHFKSRGDEGREGIKQAIIKRLLPEWSRTSLTSFSYPLLLRDPLTILVETASVAPEILRHVLILAYYACLARTVIGLVYVLNKSRSHATTPIVKRMHQDIFGDVRMFFMSVVRHSPVFEHTATLVFETFGEARIEKLLYAFTLPFLRRAAILCQSVLPASFSVTGNPADCEYNRLLAMLDIPPLSELPKQDTLQNALSGWCAHYGHSHAASQLNCGVVLDFPGIYRLARLPVVLDNLFGAQDKALTCARCSMVPADAAICLLCGATVCFQSDCCREESDPERGECNLHLRECGGAVGVYFLVKRCMMLYLYGNSGTFTPPPYLDAHGEVDISMRRGRRQYIHFARWEDVRKTWLTHGIPTLIARKMEAAMDSGGWETF